MAKPLPTSTECSDLLARVSAVLSPELFRLLERHDADEEHRVCHCRNSKCLKLYCECFSTGVLCDASRCRCLGCANNAENQAERKEVVQVVLQKNRGAFRTKIGNVDNVAFTGEHSKGCKCRKSACLKKYCECFQANVVCNDKCRCVGCQNFEGSALRDKALSLSIQRNKVPQVDSVGASAEKRNKRKRDNAKVAARLDADTDTDTDTHLMQVKRARVEQYRPFALTAAEGSKVEQANTLEAGLQPAPLAGIIQQEDIERTSVRMLQDLYNLENQRAVSEGCSKERAKPSGKEPGGDDEVDMLVCRDESSEQDEPNEGGELRDAALAELQERAVLLRVKEFLQLLSNQSYER